MIAKACVADHCIDERVPAAAPAFKVEDHMGFDMNDIAEAINKLIAVLKLQSQI